MKLSKYNIEFEDNGKRYIFNSHSLAIAQIDDNVTSGDIEQSELDDLYENGILVDDVDEELALKNEYWETVCSSKIMYLSIMPTLSCNLRCPYCFEHHNELNMTREIADKLIDVIVNKIEEEKLEMLKVDWYGGEPTLRMDVITYISERILEICRHYDIEYISSITTNATIIDSIKAKQLLDANITNMQITIDGPKEVHDKRRVGIKGEPTFDRIIKFIEQNKDNFNIVIRINMDKNNENAVDELLFFLSKKGFTNIPITIKGVVSSEERDVSATEVAGKELADLIYRKNSYAMDLGLSLAIFQSFEISPSRFCVVDCQNQFIVAPDGRLFKCGESYLDKDPGYIGNIDLSSGEMEVDDIKANKWIKDPFEMEKCANCKILPMCFGGCQMKKNVKNAEACNVDLKYHLVDYLKLYMRLLS